MSDIAKMIAIAKKFGGGGSAPAEVVILPETELMAMNISETSGQYMLTTPFENKPTGGGTCKFIWGGVEYTSPVVNATAAVGAPFQILVCGNSDILSFTEMLGSNPAPDAPFFAQIIPDGIEEDGVTQYLAWICGGEIVADPPVLSIVQTEGASADSGSGGAGVCVINMTCDANDSMNEFTNATKDKTFAEAKAVYDAGGIVHVRLKYKSGPLVGMKIEFPNANFVSMGKTEAFMFSHYATTGANYIIIQSDDTFTIEQD